MRIAILSDEYLPEGTRNHARMLHELAVEFHARGHQVVVVTPGQQFQDKRVEIGLLDGVEVWRFRMAPMRDVSKFKRAIRESLIPWNAIRGIQSMGLNSQFDLCVNYSPSIFFGGLARYFRLKGAFVYLVLRDFFPQWIIDEGMIKEGSLIAYYFRFFETLTYKAAHVLAVQSQANIAVFKRMTPYIHPNIEVLYNWSNGRLENQEPGFGKSLIEQEGLNNKIILFYGGNIGHAQDMTNLVRLARRLHAQPNVHILLVGQGDEFTLVQDLVKDWSLTNISVLPSITQLQYTSLLKEVDVGLFSLASNHTAHNFPGKLLGYMAAGIPILGSVNPGNDVIELINESGAGLVSINGNDEEFYANALSIVQSKVLREQQGKAASVLLHEAFSITSAADQILSACHHSKIP